MEENVEMLSTIKRLGFGLGLAAIELISCTESATADSKWTFAYVKGDDSTQITSCNAEIDFTDGLLLLRVYGEGMDFYFGQSTLAMPPDTELGNVAISFKDTSFVLGAFSSKSSSGETTASMYLHPEKADFKEILSRMRLADNLQVNFPDGSYYTIPLTGSAEALARVSDCWLKNPTGPAGHNPFTPNPSPNTSGTMRDPFASP
ncbi:MAG: hypothetical protein ACOH2H_20260 [Cypionkella sp.]